MLRKLFSAKPFGRETRRSQGYAEKFQEHTGRTHVSIVMNQIIKLKH
jgi:hypothetical protein